MILNIIDSIETKPIFWLSFDKFVDKVTSIYTPILGNFIKL